MSVHRNGHHGHLRAAAHHGFDLKTLTRSLSDCNTTNDKQYIKQGIDLFSTFVITHAPPADAHFRRFGDTVRVRIRFLSACSVPLRGFVLTAYTRLLHANTCLIRDCLLPQPGFPSTYQVNNLGLSFNTVSPAQASRLRARCAVWEAAVPKGQQGRSMIQSYAWVE